MPARRDPVRLLAKTTGYTARFDHAMDSREPEAVDLATQKRFSQGAHRDAAAARVLSREALAAAPVDVRVKRIRAQARQLGVDVYPQMRIVRLSLTNGRSAASVDRALRRIEQRLWPDLDA